MSDLINAQIAFLSEADRLKSVTRGNVLTDNSRDENSAEHAWHVALFALVFGDDLDTPTLARSLRMILLHDLVEIDAGDHPIDQPFDPEQVRCAEHKAADRLFDLLPERQGQACHDLWLEFEAGETPAARHALACDHIQPMFQALWTRPVRHDHLTVVSDNISSGRAARFENEWPEIHQAVTGMIAGHAVGSDTLSRRLTFLREADRLKNVLRASRLLHVNRRENSAEHSWHIMLFALIMGEHALPGMDQDRAITMLLLHDIVEIDAGDAPIHGNVDHAAMAAKETAAAKRLFGMLPPGQATHFRAIWEEFEAAQTQDAMFAKAIDRFQTPVANLANGGGTWAEYNVTLAQLSTRVGTPIQKGAPALWDWLNPQLKTFFQTNLR